MILQRFFGAVAAISAVMLMTPIVTAHAATKFCDVMPERCRWGSDGLLYYYLPGQSLPSGIPGPGGVSRPTPSKSVRATPVSAVPAAWGCGATDGKATGRSWGFPDRAIASQRALGACMLRTKRGGCHIVSCSSSIKTYYDAHTAWFVPR